MSKQTIYNFVEAINEHNVDKIYSLATDNHQFIDAHGNTIVGKDRMKESWIVYFQWFPDYKIEVTDIFANGDTFAVFGFGSGTYKGKETNNIKKHWQIPAAWKAIVNDNKIKLWQVYADTKIPFDSIGANK